MRHEELIGSGRLRHEQIDNAIAPSYRNDNPDGVYGWDDLRVDGNAVPLPASSRPTPTAIGNLQLPVFAAGGGEYAFPGWQLPHGVVTHTANQTPSCSPKWHVHIMNHAGAIPAGETVAFKLIYRVDGSAEKNVTTTYTAPSTIAQNSFNRSTGVSLDVALNYGMSTIIPARIERVAGTYAGDIALLSTDLHVKMYRFGSATETSG